MWLGRAWIWLRAWLLGVNQTMGAAVSAGLRRLRRPPGEKSLGEVWRYVNIRRLTPRQRVMFFYLALVRRGREHGFGRRAEQTPFEYQETLQQVLTGAEEDLAGLTDSFVEARYSLHPVTPAQAGRVQRWWETVRRRLRR
jgi:hypothetical protein